VAGRLRYDGVMTIPEFDVVLSYAGEDREYVERVAMTLVQHGVRVFYDRYEEVELWGKNLYQHLSQVYGKQGRYCVVFISRAYASKLWPRHELAAAQARAFAENREYILPARFDETELPGIHATTGYIDLRNRPAADFAEVVVRKLAAAGKSHQNNSLPPASATYSGRKTPAIFKKLWKYRGLLIVTLVIVLLTSLLWQPRTGPSKLQEELTPPSPLVLTADTARAAINEMVQQTDPPTPPPKLRFITTPVNGLAAVAIEPPYREFPNIVLFRYDDGAKRWSRVFEGLSVGIQFDQSAILDLHTLGVAMDVKQPEKQDQSSYLEDLGFGHGWIPVSYEKFIHLHQSGRESYYLDKRDIGRIARRLIPEAEDGFVDTECTLFDLPDIQSLSLSHGSGRFELNAETLNDQLWTVTFTGITSDGRLSHKLILADRSKE
jgi:hypothetical protein